MKPFPFFARDARLVTALAVCAVLGACSQHAGNTWQGYVEGEFVYLGSSQSGKLTQLQVARGDQVTADAPVFALESVDETAALQQAQQQLAAARAQLADIQTGKRPPEVDVTKAQLAQAIANARKATLQLTRDAAQYRVGGIPKGQLDDTRAAADSANAQVRELTHEVQVARLPGRSQQLLAQSAQVEAAQAAVAQAQWKLDQKRVSAPAKGRIYDTLYRVGEWVQAGSPVVQMLPPQNVKVRFFVPETVVGSLAPGRALTIHCDGCASDVNAKITYVSSSAEYTPPVIYSNESRAKLVFMVEAHPSVGDAPRLHPGQPVSVTLQ
ncbi:Predicted membrane fusion protein (MFP) component of efflux pump, membrane anchor protein YbhG [Paraburkholderia sabiae]|uniref:HlyD family secretion protein n=1 Tax=Paraburkholderia sabiae TaxID=273251 RepID=UPI001CABC9FB|nr:HlyD family efflux transporter periplasmic adaptor subunit [Paraburkholderia sabiae]CAG9195359.1 Predicted membrane fusion protein (MFP) component of efflux pump, membrane anchor protein YbhG [Paraburkholderia sabiae]